jgi:hypothetical protein
MKVGHSTTTNLSQSQKRAKKVEHSNHYRLRDVKAGRSNTSTFLSVWLSPEVSTLMLLQQLQQLCMHLRVVCFTSNPQPQKW